MSPSLYHFPNLRKAIAQEKKLITELDSTMNQFLRAKSPEEKSLVNSHINSIKTSLRKVNQDLSTEIENANLARPLTPKAEENILPVQQIPIQQAQPIQPVAAQPMPMPTVSKKLKKGRTKKLQKHLKFGDLEKESIKRLYSKDKTVKKKKVKRPGAYIRASSKFFSKKAEILSNRKMFKILERDMIKANFSYILPAYISMILFTTIISIFIGFILFIFFLFFNLSPALPFVTSVEGSIAIRFLKVFWILLVVPIGTFFAMYFYPALERKSAERRINQELPFATIHMAAISGSMINPTDIFKIIISTNEYPYLQKEFTKLLNEVNVYGYNLVVALKNTAFNSPSLKFTELLNGLATTINTGGDLPGFFEKRSQTLLFDHKLEREKYIKSSETFMDIYISVVIAAPMILMLLLMMMKISGIGLSLSTQMITLILVLGVVMINIVFLTFLHMKQPAE
ncbi:type II secretion system F family protein [Nanoarchaeota archaeon]